MITKSERFFDLFIPNIQVADTLHIIQNDSFIQQHPLFQNL